MVNTRLQAIECMKNLKMYMEISDKESSNKFSQDNYTAIDMAIADMEKMDKIEDKFNSSYAQKIFDRGLSSILEDDIKEILEDGNGDFDDSMSDWQGDGKWT